MRKNLSNQYEDSCFLAFFDILGFSELVASGNIDQVAVLYRNYIEQEIATLNEKEFKTEALNQIPLEFLIISDSILIYTKTATHLSFRKLAYVARHFFLLSLLRGLPLRGAITYGELRFIDGAPTVPKDFMTGGKMAAKRSTSIVLPKRRTLRGRLECAAAHHNVLKQSK